MKKRSYDERCEELARVFLDGDYPQPSKDDIEDLAQTIQDAIEDWFSANDRRR